MILERIRVIFQHIIKKRIQLIGYDFEELSNKVVAHAIIVEQVELEIEEFE